MAKKNDWMFTPANQALFNRRLIRIDAVDVPAIELFSGQETFGASPALIKRQSSYNDMFDRFLLRKVEREIPSLNLTAHELTEETRSSDLVEMYLPGLGFGSEVFLAHVWYLLTLQPAGEEGVLLTSGRGNAFHVGVPGTGIVAVGVRWNDGWNVEADSRIDAVNHQAVRWYAGCRVFSRQRAV